VGLFSSSFCIFDVSTSYWQKKLKQGKRSIGNLLLQRQDEMNILLIFIHFLKKDFLGSPENNHPFQLLFVGPRGKKNQPF
jgi:hypothetical protein